MSHIDMSSNQRLDISIQNRTEIRQFNSSPRIFHELERVIFVSPNLARPNVEDVSSTYIAHIWNSLLTSDDEKSCLQSVEGFDLIPELAPLTCTNEIVLEVIRFAIWISWDPLLLFGLVVEKGII